MERSKRDKRKKQALMGNHQRCWMWGRHAVCEMLEAGRWPVLELYLDHSLDEEAMSWAEARAARWDAPVEGVPVGRLRDLCHSSEHQGYLAKMQPFPYWTLDEALERCSGNSPLLALLDRVQDPHNFGAIIRSAEVLGVDAILVGEHHQAEVGSMVARSSSGAVNRIPIVQCEDLADTVKQLAAQGFQITAATEKGAQSCAQTDLTRPTVLLLGNEGIGLSPELTQQAGTCIAIPQQGAIGSLNVAAAAAILFYEAMRQRAPRRE